jgi:hypothetical protein
MGARVGVARPSWQGDCESSNLQLPWSVFYTAAMNHHLVFNDPHGFPPHSRPEAPAPQPRRPKPEALSGWSTPENRSRFTPIRSTRQLVGHLL